MITHNSNNNSRFLSIILQLILYLIKTNMIKTMYIIKLA